MLPSKNNAPNLIILIFKLIVLIATACLLPFRSFISCSCFVAVLDYLISKETTGFRRFFVIIFCNAIAYVIIAAVLTMGLTIPNVNTCNFLIVCIAWTFIFGIPLDLFGSKSRKEEPEQATGDQDIEKTDTNEGDNNEF